MNLNLPEILFIEPNLDLNSAGTSSLLLFTSRCHRASEVPSEAQAAVSMTSPG